MCGTPYYVPPEMLIKKEYDKTIDIWSIGILMYEFLTGKCPFQSKTMSAQDVFQKIKNSDKYLNLCLNIEKNAIDLLRRILKSDPKDRISL